MAKKEIELRLWKLSLVIGILLGIGIKLLDYSRVGYIRCGVFKPAGECSGLWQYLKELPIWMVLGIIVAFVVIYGGRYLIIHVFHSAKNIKMPKREKKEAKKESKKEVKEEHKKEEKKEKPKKVIKI